MLFFLSLGLLLLVGFITVATEAFTHLVTVNDWWSTFREFLLEAWLFSLTASLWAGFVWLGLRWLQISVGFIWVLEVLAFAHLPLLAYPLTILPTLGYRLEQILRMLVFLSLTAALTWRCELAITQAAVLALPGWLAHFLNVEWRLFRRSEKP